MNKNKGIIGIGLILAIVLGIAVIGGGAYYLGAKKNTKVVENNSHEVPAGPYGTEADYVAPNQVVNNPTTPQVATGCTSSSVPSITVLSPNGGETYKAGDKVTVKWKSCNFPSNANGINITIAWIGNLEALSFPVANGTPNDGQELITLPNQDKIKDFYTNTFKVHIQMNIAGQNLTVNGDESDNTFTINSPTTSISVTDSNVIKQIGCGVSFSKTSDWSVISNTSNETKLDILPNEHTGFSGIDIKCVLGNNITDTDAKFGNITYYYNSNSQKWMVSAPNERDGGTLPTVEATPLFTVNGLPVFRGTGRWLTYIIPISSSSILSLNEGDTEGGYTQTLTNLVKTIKKL